MSTAVETRAGDSARAYRLGVVLIFLGAVTASWAGLGVRLIESATPWQILVYRSIAAAGFLLLYIAWRSRGRVAASFRDAGGVAIVGALGLAAAFTGIIVAIDGASVANAMLLLAVAPFLAAVMGRLLLGEGVRVVTWLAIACAFAGVGIMVAEGVSVGHLWGNVAGLVAAFGMATYIVALRKGHLTDMLPLNAIGAFVGFLLALAVCAATGQGIALSLHDTLWSLALGVFQLGLALVLYTAGSRTVPAADISLVAMAEVVLAPLWVWLLLGETAGSYTIVGGMLLLAAIAGDAISGIRDRRRREGVR